MVELKHKAWCKTKGFACSFLQHVFLRVVFKLIGTLKLIQILKKNEITDAAHNG